MSFEVDRQSSAWANIALCADLTWATEPPDDFVIANQRLWSQHCRVSKVLQDNLTDNSNKFTSNNNLSDLTEKEQSDKRPNPVQNDENAAATGSKSVKDVIPESRLARFYGNFYYDDLREKCYINSKEKCCGRYLNGHGCDTSSDLTECWMLPEVEYWFRRLTDEGAECGMRRARRYCQPHPDDFERWGLAGAGPETAEVSLARRVRAVRSLWDPGPTPTPAPPSPPATPRKMRARRRQPRRPAHYAPPPAAVANLAATPLCGPSQKFQSEAPRPPQMIECQRAMARLTASVQVAMRASSARLYRSPLARFAPIPSRAPSRSAAYFSQRRILDSPRLSVSQASSSAADRSEPKPSTSAAVNISIEELHDPEPDGGDTPSDPASPEPRGPSPSCASVVLECGNEATTSSAPPVAADDGSRARRLYSTVLSTSAPRPLGLAPALVRLSQKRIPPGLLKLNPKIILPAARIRTATVDRKFEELEKEALEQYKASDESIDTKLRELEDQAVQQYSASNSNTSCSSGASAAAIPPPSPATPPERRSAPGPKVDCANESMAKFHKDKAIGGGTVRSQNFPDGDAKEQRPNVTNLKNFPIPQTGEKKQQIHKPRKNFRYPKSDNAYAASDTDYEARVALTGGHKAAARRVLRVAPPKKRLKKNVTVSASELAIGGTPPAPAALGDVAGAGGARGSAPARAALSAHGAGDLEPFLKKT